MNAIEKKIQYANELTYGVISNLYREMKILIGLDITFYTIGISKLKNASRNYKKKEIEKDINK